MRVAVGSAADRGGFGFGPAAVEISPGTTVVWEWTGDGGTHNFEASDGSFESDIVGAKGHTFTRILKDTGTTTYFCLLHMAMGMKEAVVVA